MPTPIIKPRCRYIDMGRPPEIGKAASLSLPNVGWVKTTPVQKMWDERNGPAIETLNTIYVPFDNDEPWRLKGQQKQLFKEVIKCR